MPIRILAPVPLELNRLLSVTLVMFCRRYGFGLPAFLNIDTGILIRGRGRG